MKVYLGLDAGGTNLAAGVVDGQGRFLSRASMPSGAGRHIEEITADMVEVARRAVAQAGVSWEDVHSWGVGMPSCVNAATRRLVHANCFGWKDVPIYEYLEGPLPVPVYIENDANCAVLGEYYAGRALGRKNVLMLTLGTGMGSGIIIDGALFTGADGMGAELGHTKVVYKGRRCSCGQEGCADIYCSATGLIAEARELLATHTNSSLAGLGSFQAKAVFDAAREGDACGALALEHYTDYLAAALSNFIPVFRPELILLGGGVAGAGETLLAPLREKTRAVTYAADVIGIPEIEAAALGNDAGIIGAAFVGRNKEE